MTSVVTRLDFGIGGRVAYRRNLFWFVLKDSIRRINVWTWVPHPSVSRVRFFSMRNPLRRHYGRGDLHFVTFSCYGRRPLLATPWARDRFVEILDQVRSRFGFRLIGYVVMPEHVHLLISEPNTADPSKALQVLKQNVSRELRREENNTREPEAHLWQRRFYDFNVWSSAKVREKLEYMHANPVKRKLVEHPKEWPWSSWSHYENGGGV